LLPTYDVFDEARHFDAYEHNSVVEIGGAKVGVSICEDLWNDKQFWKTPRYRFDPVEELAARGAEAIVNLSASPYAMGKRRVRREMLAAAARRHRLPIAMCNLVGGDDSLIFDGRSLVVSAGGEIVRECAAFREELVIEELSLRSGRPAVVDAEKVEPPSAPLAVVASYETELDDESCAELADALTLGIRDYAVKTGFKTAVLGLSGGVDSALTAVLAARALGPQNVTCIAMPSRYTASMSNDDAEVLARRLGT